MNRAQLAYQMLKEKGTVRMGDLPREGVLNFYTERNAFAEAKAMAAADGCEIVHAYGKGWQENSYTLRRIEQDEDTSTMRVACLKCGNVFEARARDIKRGFGRACSRKCAGALKSEPRANVDSLAAPENAAQGALL
jgi:hypothetical protein